MRASLREWIGRALAAAGVERLYAAASPQGLGSALRTLAIEDAALAALLADADGRLGPAPGAALLGDRLLRISSRPQGEAQSVRLTEPETLPAALQKALARASGLRPASAVLEFELDLDAPVPAGWADTPPRDAPAPALPAIPEVRRSVMLAGPGVLRAGAVTALRRLAERAGLGVANSWGAKGLFDWRSEHHMGTAGLQARDFALLGFGDADLILASGVDPDESPDESAALGAPVVRIDPRRLDELAAGWRRPPAKPEPNELMRRLSAVCRPLQRDTSYPLSPGRAIGDLRALLKGDDLVVADPGPAGFWVARAFPTTTLGSVVVPATRTQGFAAAAALVAALRAPSRRAVAVTSELDPLSRRALEYARARRLPLTLALWSEENEGEGQPVTDVDAHRELMAASLAKGGVQVIRVPVRWRDSERLLEIAGPIVAWDGLLS